MKQEITSRIIEKVYGKRDKDTKKYDRGMVIVVGGSRLYSGSPVLAALAAFRAGADMTQIIAPERAADIAASISPVLVSFPLSGEYLTKEHLSDLLAFVRSGEEVTGGNLAVVLGGGMGRREETKKVIRSFLNEISVPVVIDADAIYAIEGQEMDFSNKRFIFTPHLYEFYVLTGKRIDGIKDQGEEVRIAAEKFSSIILLKGATDFITDGKELALNKMSVPHLATGGCGDTLAGIAGALLARGTDPFIAAQAAAFINTSAGKLAAAKRGESLIATDVIEEIHKVIN